MTGSRRRAALAALPVGFAGDGTEGVIPEYHLPQAAQLQPGSEMWRLDADGSEHLVGVLDAKGEWVGVVP